MEAWYRRSKFTYPAGVPYGWDPTHPAARNLRFSAVVANGSYKQIAPYTRHATVGATPPTFGNHSHLGPVGVFNGANSSTAITFTGQSTAADAVATLAAIVTVGTAGGSFSTHATSGPTNAAYSINTTNTPGFQMVLPGIVVTANVFTISLNTPYFIATSNITGLQNYVLCNLISGQIQTATTASTYTAAAQFGTVDIGSYSNVGELYNGDIAAVMWSNTFLGFGTLLQWASDPWAFWYPQPEENWVGVTAAATKVPELALLGVGM